MDENRLDDLELFFRNRMLREDNSSGNWDVPDDSVFENAMAEVGEKVKKKRMAFAWRFAGLLLLLFVIGYIVISQVQLKNLNDQIEYLQIANNKLHVKAQDLEVEISEDTTKIVNAYSNNDQYTLQYDRFSPILTIHEQDHASSSQHSDISESPHDYYSINNEHEKKVLISGPVEHRIVTNEFRTTDKLSIVEPVVIQLKLLPVLSYKAVTSLNFSEIGNVDAPMIMINQQSDKKQKINNIDLQFWGGVAFSSLQMTNIDEDQMFSLDQYNKYYLGRSFGLGLTQHAGKWSFEGRVSYQHLHNQSNYQGKGGYHTDNEFTINQEINYVDDIGVETPFGKSTAPVQFGVTNVKIDDNDEMDINTVIDQNFDVVGGGAFAHYRFWTNQKFSAYLGVGMSLSYIFNSSQQLDRSLLYDNQMLMSDLKANMEIDGINKLYYGYSTHLKFTYSLNDDIGILIGTSYDRSINSIRNANQELNPNTYISNIGLNFGVYSRL